MSEILVEVTRGPLVESIHRGHVAVVNGQGNVLSSAGNPELNTYMRSASKPVQALEVILSGAADRFEFTDRELAIMCASHYGEPFHRETVAGVLKKVGLTLDDMKCGTVTSLNHEYALELAKNNENLDPSFSDCSGKHAGFLAVCVHRGYSLENYLSPEHPLQKGMLSHISILAGIPESEIAIGIDGCSVPVFGFPLKSMALLFAMLANPENAPAIYRKALARLYNAMVNNPLMVSGTGGFCTELITHANGRLVGKVGAEGVYCVGVKGKNTGFALKIEDGNFRAVWPAAMEVINQLDVLKPEEFDRLKSFHMPPSLNDVNTVVGHIKPVFNLRRHC